MTTSRTGDDGYAVSVVVSTHNRSADLAAALEALLQQTAPVHYEILIVDNNSTDDTREVVARAIPRSPVPLRYLFEARQGVSYGRNTGILHAKAPIVAFTDDDCRPAPDWVASICRAFAEHPDIDCIGGRVVPRWPDTVPAWFARRQGSPLAICDHGDQTFPVDAEHAATCLLTANLACRRSVFDKAGMFSPDYPRGQDREIQLRMWAVGCRGLYEPSVRVDVPIPPGRLTKEYFRAWYSRYGVVHARLELLERLDSTGRLVQPSTHSRLFGTAPHVYRSFAASLWGWIVATARWREGDRFYHENRIRYLGKYIATSFRLQRATRAFSIPKELRRFLASRLRAVSRREPGSRQSV